MRARALLLGLLLPLLACAPSDRQRRALDRWLACTECNQSELDSVVNLAGFRVVRALSRALGGATDAELAAMRIQYIEEYRQLVAIGAAPLPQTQDAFVADRLANFVAERVKRSARALARVDGWLTGWMARRALANVRDLSDDPAYADRYRADVRAELHAALVTSVSVVDGAGQTDTVGRAVDVPPAVLVRDGATPLAGVPVEFRVASGGGSVTGALVTTDASGRAVVGSWTLGPTAGSNTLAARAGRHADTVVATALEGLVLEIVAGAVQSGRAGDTAHTTPVVRALNAAGTPAAGVAVQFEVTQGGGIIAAANVVTGSDGLASPGLWILGAPGLNLLTARAVGRPDVVIRAQAVPALVPIP